MELSPYKLECLSIVSNLTQGNEKDTDRACPKILDLAENV